LREAPLPPSRVDLPAAVPHYMDGIGVGLALSAAASPCDIPCNMRLSSLDFSTRRARRSLTVRHQWV
jgi:hypothetical protein